MPPTPTRFSARILPLDRSFDAPAGTSLLVAAREAGIDLPASCRNGTCRTCMCRLSDGSVTYRIEWPGVTREEKQQGWILPCVAHAASNLVIEVPAAKLVGAD